MSASAETKILPGDSISKSTDCVDGALIRLELGNILRSREFSRSDRLCAFLSYVVEASMAGEKTQLSERRIGELVFGKEIGWDPRTDTIVRSEARRLRRKLREYYSDEGNKTGVLIDLPVGTYVATFTRLERPDTSTPRPVEGPDQAEVSSVKEPGHRKLIWWPLVAALIILIAAGAVLAGRHTSNPSQTPAQSSGAFHVIPFADEIGEEYSPSVSPDDKRIAYIWDGNSHQPNVYIKDVDGVTRTQVTQGDARCFSPAWSPDGLSLAYLRLTGADLSVLVRDLRSGHEREITRVRHETGRWSSDNGPLLGDVGPVWSQDGQSLFVADRLFEDAGVGGIYRIDIRTGSRDQITSAPGETRDFSPRISPNGRTLAFVRYFSHGHGELFTAPSSGGKVVRLTADNRDIQGLTWSRDGMSLIFSSNRSGYFQLWSLGLQGGSPLLLSTNTTSATAPFAFHRSDALAFVDAAENWNIWRMSIRDGKLAGAAPLLTSSGRNHDARYSPDGRQIAYISDRSGSFEIWLANSDGTAARQLTHFNGGWINSLSWAPDGTKLAFDARPKGYASIYSVSLKNGAITAIDDAGLEQRMPCWSRDGRFIYFNSVKDGAVAIYRKSLDSGEETRISEHEMYTVAESPDGIHLYYSDRAGHIWIAGLDGSHPTPLNITALPVKSWAATPDGLIYSWGSSDHNPGLITLWRHGGKLDLGSPAGRLITNDPDLSLSPDGKSLLVGQEDQIRSDIKIRLTS